MRARPDRAYLEGIADAYLKALAARDPSRAPFAAHAVFAENDQRLPLGAASWARSRGWAAIAMCSATRTATPSASSPM